MHQAKVDSMQGWFQKNRDTVIKYSELKDMKQSQQFLAEHLDLLCDHMASFLVIYCVDLQVDNVRRNDLYCLSLSYHLLRMMQLSRTLRDRQFAFRCFGTCVDLHHAYDN